MRCWETTPTLGHDALRAKLLADGGPLVLPCQKLLPLARRFAPRHKLVQRGDVQHDAVVQSGSRLRFAARERRSRNSRRSESRSSCLSSAFSAFLASLPPVPALRRRASYSSRRLSSNRIFGST